MTGPTVQPARVALVGQGTFQALKALQDAAPGPRLEMRYWIEGMTTVLRQEPDLGPAWLDQAREAVLHHLQARQQAPHQGVHQDTHQDTHQDLGTGSQKTAEGAASARTTDTPPRHLGTRQDGCKALQIGEATFQWLKGVQGTTRDPRIEIRYLLEGAVTLFLSRPPIPAVLVRQARRALLEHLALLENIPLAPSNSPSLLEKTP